MTQKPQTHAQVFLRRFPTARDETGWSDANIALLNTTMGERRITPEEFDAVCTRMLTASSRQRHPVPPFGEVCAYADQYRRRRYEHQRDAQVERLRRQRTEPPAWTEQQKADRKAWLEDFKRRARGEST